MDVDSEREVDKIKDYWDKQQKEDILDELNKGTESRLELKIVKCRSNTKSESYWHFYKKVWIKERNIRLDWAQCLTCNVIYV